MNKNANSADVRGLTRATQKSWKVFRIDAVSTLFGWCSHKGQMNRKKNHKILVTLQYKPLYNITQ